VNRARTPGRLPGLVEASPAAGDRASGGGKRRCGRTGMFDSGRANRRREVRTRMLVAARYRRVDRATAQSKTNPGREARARTVDEPGRVTALTADAGVTWVRTVLPMPLARGARSGRQVLAREQNPTVRAGPVPAATMGIAWQSARDTSRQRPGQPDPARKPRRGGQGPRRRAGRHRTAPSDRAVGQPQQPRTGRPARAAVVRTDLGVAGRLCQVLGPRRQPPNRGGQPMPRRRPHG